MATKASACQRNPHFAVICSFLQQHGALLGQGIEDIAFDDLESYLEETKKGKLGIKFSWKPKDNSFENYVAALCWIIDLKLSPSFDASVVKPFSLSDLTT